MRALQSRSRLEALFQSLRQTVADSGAVGNLRFRRLMVRFKTSNPQFYGAYKTARKIVKQAATHDKSKIARLKKNDGSGSGSAKAA